MLVNQNTGFIAPGTWLPPGTQALDKFAPCGMTLVRMDTNKTRQVEYKDEIPQLRHHVGSNHNCCSTTTRTNIAWASGFDDEDEWYEEFVVREGCDAWHAAMSGLAFPVPGGLNGTLFQLPYKFRVPGYPSARVWPGTTARPFLPPAPNANGSPALNVVWDYTIGAFTPIMLAGWLAGSFAYNLFFASEISQYSCG